jgi:hypothetical protein
MVLQIEKSASTLFILRACFHNLRTGIFYVVLGRSSQTNIANRDAFFFWR